MKYSWSLLIGVVILCSCSLFQVRSSRGTVLYEGKISTGEEIRVIYSDNTTENLCRVSVYNNDKLTDKITVGNLPQRFVVDKDYQANKRNSPIYRMVSDTNSNLFRCINYNFPQELCTPQTQVTFISITSREREIMSLLAKILSEGGYKIKMSQSEADRMIGWVRVK